MLKLYKQTDNEIYYWETWDKDAKTAIIHWGVVGERGAQRQVFSGILSSFKRIVNKEMKKQLANGYHEVDLDSHHTLLIEYKVDGMGAPDDVDMRSLLQNRISQTLGWTGLGDCDGGSIGSGTMEVCCYVIDFDIAKKVIEDDLKDTEFADYIRIFESDEE